MKNKIRSAVLSFLLYSSADAQLLINTGTLIYSEPNAIIKIEGGAMNEGNIIHEGFVQIDDFYSNTSTGNTKGSGVYEVAGDWINSGIFIRDTSHVFLNGANQLITGDSITRYFNLTLQGTGIKTQTINSYVYSALDLNSRELATNEDTMFVINPSPSAIVHNSVFGSEGFVSSLDSGTLVRYTNSNAEYLFPLGSSIGTPRYRQLILTPSSSVNASFASSLVNESATLKGYNLSNYDTSLCTVQPLYFHKINRLLGLTSADLELFYLQTADGYWDALGNWKSADAKWKNIYLNTETTAMYNSVKRMHWNDFTNEPYALISAKPQLILSGDTLVCKNSASTFYAESSGSGYLYSWNVTGGNIIGDSTSNSINISFTHPGNYNVTATVTNPLSGCVSNNAVFHTTVGGNTIADFIINYSSLLPNSIINLMDNSTNASTWNWNFGNGYNSNSENPQTAYDNTGTYTITLTTTDSLGCTDTITKEIQIKPGILIPNVFTPNGDGVNDVFLIPQIGLSDYKIELFNRWGQLIYSGGEGTAAWDGTTPTGEKCPEGTYFVVITGNMENKKFEYKGNVQLTR